MNKILYYLIVLFFTIPSDCEASLHDTLTIHTLLRNAQFAQSVNADSSYVLITQAMQAAEASHYQKGMADAYVLMGSYLNVKGENDKAIALIRKACSIREKLGNHAATSQAYLRLSYIFKDMGLRDSVYKSLYQSLREGRLGNDSTLVIPVYVQLGNANVSDKDSNEAYQHFQKALQMSKAINDTPSLRISYAGLGNYFWNCTDTIEIALHFFLLESKLYQADDNPSAQAINLMNIGLCYVALENFTLAKTYYQQALNTCIRIGMKNQEALMYFNMGCMYSFSQQRDSAIHYFHASYNLAREIKDLNRVSRCLDSLSSVYASKGNYSKAFEYLSEFKQLNDTLLNKERINSIEDSKRKYKTELQDEKIKFQTEQIHRERQYLNRTIIVSIFILLLLLIVIRQHFKVNREKKRSEHLLLNILPSEVAEELKETGGAIAKYYNNVSVLFTDFVNFTHISEQMSPTELVAEIHQCFTAFDAIIERNQLEKIKTIGDAYLAVCGLPHEDPNHAIKTTQAALEIRDWLQKNNTRFQIRIGINSGPVVAGIVGVKKFAYDIWGDTVNIASRMESSGQAGKINISGSTYELVKDAFNCTYRGKIEAKNKGEIDMYFVD